jgi:predicted esterase
MYTTDRIYPGTTTLNLLIHGQGSSRGEWLEKDGYTKGGNLTEILCRDQISWAAADMYGHGEWSADEPDFDPENVDDETWEKLVGLTLANLMDILTGLIRSHRFASMNIITYSAGSVLGARLLAEKLPLPVGRILMAAPTPQRDFDDGYSLHNNLSIFEGRKVFLYAGTSDDEVSIDETRWLFGQIPGDGKTLREYDGGHSLPLAWVTDALKDLAE